MAIPQLICITLYVVNFFLAVKQHNKEQKGNESAGVSIVAFCISLSILAWGGFFDNALPIRAEKTAQVVFVILYMLSLGLNVADDGEKKKPRNAYARIVSATISQAILFWGGFYDVFFK